MATPQLVSEVMTKDVVSVSEDQTLADLLASMRGMRFRHTPVTDDGRLVGLLSERDLLRMSSRSLLPHRDGDEVLHRRFHVRDVMTKDVATVSPSTTRAVRATCHAVGEPLFLQCTWQRITQ